MDYMSDIKINPGALDLEWLKQPTLFMQYAEQASKAREACDRAKATLDVVQAECSQAIRNDPASFNIDKVTEATIASAVTLHPDVRGAMSAFIQAKSQQDLLMSAVRAFDQRRDALENLVKLHGQSYFASPRTPRDLTEEARKEIEERQHVSVTNAIQARRVGRRVQ